MHDHKREFTLSDRADEAEYYEQLSAAGLNRRELLQLLGPGVVIFFSLDRPSFALQQRPGGERGYPADFNAYLRIGEDGRVSCFTGKIEMGQGIIASLAQMLAEELEVPYASVDVVLGDTRLCPWDGGTNGSRTTKYFGPALRAAGAEAREVLLQLAAEQLKVPAGRLAVRDGTVFDSANPATSVTYAALARGKTIERHLEKKPAPKPISAHTVCGKPLPRKDAREKVSGRAQYTGDLRRPGMLYAKVLRPPQHGAKLKSLDVSAAREAQDARIIQEEDLVAVLHPLPDLAEKALLRIKAEFDLPAAQADDRTIHQQLQKFSAAGDVLVQKGDLARGRELAKTHFEETYLTPYVAHAPMETHSALAEVQAGEATVWVSTQRPFGIRDEIARALDLAADKVRVITPYVGGGFGGKSQGRQAVEAARLSKLAGVPVQVVWSREEEFFYDTFMPAAFVKIASGLDEEGRVVYWDYQVGFAGERSSRTFYDVPHRRTVSAGGRMPGGGSVHPFGTGAWRGPGSNTNTFAMESHMDVMAAKAGMDPVEFRLKNLSDPRMIRVIRAAAGKFGWTPAKAPSRRGYGMACLDYLNSYLAAMAEIKFDPATGRIAVERVVLAQDMGEVINPEGARRQIEGCITMGLGFALTEEIRFSGGDIQDRNFDTYRIPRISWVPKIETVLVENPELAPQGCGEPAITCMGALIANALFDASGVRVKRLPLTPERIREAASKTAPA